MYYQRYHAFHPDVVDKVAKLEVQPGTDREHLVIQLSVGPNRKKLRPSRVIGPFLETEIENQFQSAIEDLSAEGYYHAGVLALIEALHHDDSRKRAHAAIRLGWRGANVAVEHLLNRLQVAVDDSCSILDALGMIGDARAFPKLREYAERKLLSRRRSAVEALRQAEDQEGLQQAIARSQQRIEELCGHSLTEALAHPKTLKQFIEELRNLEPAKQALILDSLYEIGSPPAIHAVMALLSVIPISRPFFWRSVKSVFKRAMLRHDYDVFAKVYQHIEHSLEPPVTDTLRSGYDGSERVVTLFSGATRKFLRRASWRYLVDIARYKPANYASAAASVLISYTNSSLQKSGEARCHLLKRILFGGPRQPFQPLKMLVNWFQGGTKAPKTNPAYAELWELRPQAYLQLLAHAELVLVQEFALNTLNQRHPLLIRSADHQLVLKMLQAPFEPTVQMALTELDRRFSPENPDWDLLRGMLADDRPRARSLGQQWLRTTAPLWLKEVDRIIDFLELPHPNTRAMVAEFVAGAVATNSELRDKLVPRIIAILRAPETSTDFQSSLVNLIQLALVDDVNQRLSPPNIADLVQSSSIPVSLLAAQLLASRSDTLESLGTSAIVDMAQHDYVKVRQAAFTILQSRQKLLREDPTVLLDLAESEWPDAREFAFHYLQQATLENLGLAGLMVLLDSNIEDVQELATAIARKNIASLASADLLQKLAEQPHRRIRQFVLELALECLDDDSLSLDWLQGFARAVLFSPWPRKKEKQMVCDFLKVRGLQDLHQAEIAIRILGDWVRSATLSDANRAMEILIRLRLAFPELPSTVRLLPGGVV